MEIKSGIFLSDLHIETDHEIEEFLNFIKKRDDDAFFFLGDIFEFFAYDNPKCIKKYEKIINELKVLSKKGKRVVFLEGNHDFALDGRFVSDSKIEVSQKEYALDLNGKKTILIHGDVFLSNRIFRKLLRSRIIKGLVKIVPALVLMRFGFYLSSIGKGKRNIVKEEMKNAQMVYLKKHFSEEYEVIISGHIHTPIIKNLSTKRKTILWINPGGPANFCEYRDGEFYIKSYPK